jgi:ABC-type antimicrobial peptide transport system permease subunit
MTVEFHRWSPWFGLPYYTFLLPGVREIRGGFFCQESARNLEAGAATLEIAFNFRVDLTAISAGVVFALVVGAFGGFFPARAAARKEIVIALRET